MVGNHACTYSGAIAKVPLSLLSKKSLNKSAFMFILFLNTYVKSIVDTIGEPILVGVACCTKNGCQTVNISCSMPFFRATTSCKSMNAMKIDLGRKN